MIYFCGAFALIVIGDPFKPDPWAHFGVLVWGIAYVAVVVTWRRRKLRQVSHKASR
jgi:hypothetical protein